MTGRPPAGLTVEVVPPGGGRPVRLPAVSAVVYDRRGVVVGVAVCEGPAGCVRLSHPQDPDFAAACQAVGLDPPPVRPVALRP